MKSKGRVESRRLLLLLVRSSSASPRSRGAARLLSCGDGRDRTIATARIRAPARPATDFSLRPQARVSERGAGQSASPGDPRLASAWATRRSRLRCAWRRAGRSGIARAVCISAGARAAAFVRKGSCRAGPATSTSCPLRVEGGGAWADAARAARVLAAASVPANAGLDKAGATRSVAAGAAPIRALRGSAARREEMRAGAKPGLVPGGRLAIATRALDWLRIVIAEQESRIDTVNAASGAVVPCR